MLRKIIETIGTRYLVAFLNLILLVLNARALGIHGVGLIGLVLAAVNIVMMCNSVLSGNTIVYFMNRYPSFQVFIPAYLWTISMGALASCMMWICGLIPEGYGMHVYLLSLLLSLTAANARFLLGTDCIRKFNLTYTLQGGLLFVAVLILYYVFDVKTVDAYICGLYIANGTAWIISLLWVMPLLKRGTWNELPSLTWNMFLYGLWAGVDNLAEQFTSRINYFLLQRFSGVGSVGLFDAGTKVSESVWNISRSISFIVFGKVSQTEDANIQKRITIQLVWLTLLATTIVMLFVLLIPEFVFTSWLFGQEFSGIRKVIICLTPGVIALACNSIFSHFFIGSGRVRISTISSLLGLSVLLLTGSLLIPVSGVPGAALSGSAAYLSMLSFSIIQFCRITSTRVGELLPDKTDITSICRRIRNLVSRSGQS